MNSLLLEVTEQKLDDNLSRMSPPKKHEGQLYQPQKVPPRSMPSIGLLHKPATMQMK